MSAAVESPADASAKYLDVKAYAARYGFSWRHWLLLATLAAPGGCRQGTAADALWATCPLEYRFTGGVGGRRMSLLPKGGAPMPRAQVNMKDLTFAEDVLPRMVRSGPLVDEFTEILRLGAPDGTEMGLGVVFHDGSTFWVADGTKRLTAQDRIGIVRPWVDLKKGTKGDAIWYAIGANREHGVRLSNAEKRQATINALKNPDIAETFTHESIAEQVGVSRSLVTKLLAELERGGQALMRRPKRQGVRRAGRRPISVEKAEAATRERGLPEEQVQSIARRAEIEHLLNALQSWVNGHTSQMPLRRRAGRVSHGPGRHPRPVPPSTGRCSPSGRM